MKLTTYRIKQIIKEELDGVYLEKEIQWLWPPIKKRLQKLSQHTFPAIEYTKDEEQRIIKKYPDYFPSKKPIGFVPFQQADGWLMARGYPGKSETGEEGFYDTRKVYPHHWELEGVKNIWERDLLDYIEKYVNSAAKETKSLEKLVITIAKKIQTSLRTTSHRRKSDERDMLYGILNDISSTIELNPLPHLPDSPLVDEMADSFYYNTLFKLSEIRDLAQSWSNVGA